MNSIPITKKIMLTACVLSMLLGFSMHVSAKTKMPSNEPDYTRGEQLPGGRVYWNLGPIGAVGNIWHGRGSNATSRTRMMQIKEVIKGGPGEGNLVGQDVILGVVHPRLPSGVDQQFKFTADAPETLAWAIGLAEKKKHGGKLVLRVWRPETRTIMWQHPRFKRMKPIPKQEIIKPIKSKVVDVTIQLPVKGSYSSTAPYDCEKTQQLIKDAAKHIVESSQLTDGKKRDHIDAALMGLGLLATGEEKYWKLVGDYVKRYDQKSAEEYRKSNAWFIAYQNLLATEYYLATKDQKALPVVEKLSHAIATGRSGVGTWGHGLTDLRQNNGEDYGIAPAYGAMNQVSLTCTISLVLAQKCGVKSDAVAKAVEKSSNFLRFYCKKGCLPYGDHAPGRVHNNNGSSGQAAVLFSLLGDEEAAEFFATMSLASLDDQEGGHTGPFFNRLWTPLGVAVTGKTGLHEFLKHNRWRTELMRLPNGSFPYQLALGQDDRGKYVTWDTTGCRMLEFCLPRKQLYITGKGREVVEAYSQQKVDRIIETADIKLGGKSPEELIKFLQHWSPVVRKGAAIALAKQDAHVTRQILNLFSSSNPYANYGAAIAAKYVGRGSEDMVDELIKMTKHESMTMRYFGLVGLVPFDSRRHKEAYAKGLGGAAKKAIPDLLEMVYRDYPDEYRHWTHMYATFTLFGGHSKAPLMSERDWNEMASKERVRLVKQLLKLDNGEARSAMSHYYQYLTKEETAQLIKEVYAAVKKPAPSAVMFNAGVRVNGLKLLAENNIKEGVQAGLDFMFEWGWGGGARRQNGPLAMKNYGQHVPKETLDELMKVANGARGAKGRSIKEALKYMRTTPGPELIPIEEFIKKHLEK